MRDNRDQFEFEYWQQGYLLDTPVTRRWSANQRQATNAEERLRAFSFFTSTDQGRGREFVFRFESAEACAEAVKAHNLLLNKMHPKMLAALREKKGKEQKVPPLPMAWE